MTRHRALAILISLSSLLVVGRAAPQDDRGPAAPAGWEQRLEALRPDRPLAYFELAEEIADAATTDRERELARQLLALAGALDEPRLGRAACLALADLAEDPRQRARLRALAWLLAERYEQAIALDEAMRDQEDAPLSPVALAAVTEALSLYRRGQGARALAALRTPGAADLLEANDRLLVGGANRFLEDCRLYRNGERRPTLSPADVTQMLRLEAALLAGPQRSWSGELLLRPGQTLVEVDPEGMAQTLGVDVTRAVYRDGRWVGE
jgi:hypothetical protein